MSISLETKMSELAIKVGRLEERVDNHKDDIGEHKEEMNNMNKKLTAIIIIMCLNGSVSAIANWAKIAPILGI